MEKRNIHRYTEKEKKMILDKEYDDCTIAKIIGVDKGNIRKIRYTLKNKEKIAKYQTKYQKNRRKSFELIKDDAIMLLNIQISKTEFPTIIQHPIFSNSIVFIQYSEKEWYDLDIKEDLDFVTEYYTNLINNSKNIHEIFMLINKPYRLFFYKLIRNYLSNKDKNEYLAHIWVESENPNQDVNVPISTIVEFFKDSNKKLLMTKEDYKYYENLPNVIKVYRGVSNGRNPNGLSWTDDFDKAVWFSKRFGEGYILSGLVHKDNVLAYFNTRGEKELIIERDNVNLLEKINPQ